MTSGWQYLLGRFREVHGSKPAKRCPVLVVQADSLMPAA